MTIIIANPPLDACGTDPVTITLPVASATTDGYLSAADWNTFNNKGIGVGTVTSIGSDVYGLSIIAQTNSLSPLGTSVNVSLSGILEVPLANINAIGSRNNTTFLRGDGTWAAPTLPFSVSEPLRLHSGVLSLPVANATNNGYLSKEDWIAFNAKGNGTVTTITTSSTQVYGLSISANSSGLSTGTVNLSLSGTLNVPVSRITATGTANSNTFLRGDGSWHSAVTSVTGTGSVAGITLSGNVTSDGFLTLGGTLSVPVANINAPGIRNNTTFLRGDGSWAVPTSYYVYGAGSVNGITLSGNSNTGIISLGGTLTVPVANIQATGNKNSTTFLRGDGTWDIPSITLTANYPLAVSGTASNKHISIPFASALTDGYLTHQDWTVFNNKGTLRKITAIGSSLYGLKLISQDNDLFNADTVNISLSGTLSVPLANIEATGSRNIATFLRGDGTWREAVQAVEASGSVSGITLTSSTTSVGTSSITLSGELSVPLSSIEATGVRGNTTFLRGDGTWQTVGSVKSVGATGFVSGLHLQVAPTLVGGSGPITNTGTIMLGGKLVVNVEDIHTSGSTQIPSSNNYLRGDGTWNIPRSTVYAQAPLRSINNAGDLPNASYVYMPRASSSSDGYLHKDDFTIFFNKGTIRTVTSIGAPHFGLSIIAQKPAYDGSIVNLSLSGDLRVPVPNIIATGVRNSTTFLRGDGTWAPVSGGSGGGEGGQATGSGTVNGITLSGVGNLLLGGAISVPVQNIEATGEYNANTYLRGDGTWAEIKVGPGLSSEFKQDSYALNSTVVVVGNSAWATIYDGFLGGAPLTVGTVFEIQGTAGVQSVGAGQYIIDGHYPGRKYRVVAIETFPEYTPGNPHYFFAGQSGNEYCKIAYDDTGELISTNWYQTVEPDPYNSNVLRYVPHNYIMVNNGGYEFTTGAGYTINVIDYTGGISQTISIADTIGDVITLPITSIQAAGDRTSSTFLRGDGVWATAGTVTSVTGTGTVAGLTLTGNVTESGSLTLGGTLAVPVGNINASGTAASTTFLRGDGAWAPTGTVTSVTGTGTVAGLTLSGTVTDSGELTLGGTLEVPTIAIAASGNRNSTTFLRGDAVWATTGTVTSVSGTGTVAGLTLTGDVTTSGELVLGGTLAVPVESINASGIASASTFLRGDGSWSSAGTGTVTSVTGTGTVSGLTLSGTVTGSGNLTLGGTLSVAMSSLNASGTRSSSTFLRGDGAWATAGTVTSVSGTGTVSGLTLTGTITNSGSLTLGGTLSVAMSSLNASGTADNTTFLRGDGVWASVSSGSSTVPLSSIEAVGTLDNTTYLRGDGTWATLPGGGGGGSGTGTVTSVYGTGTVSGITLTGTVTDSGSLTLGGTLSVAMSSLNASGTANNTTFLRGDGVWASTGTVTSVSGTGTVAGLTLSGAITNSGELTLGGTLAVSIESINASGTADSTTYLRGDGAWVSTGTVTSVTGTGSVSGLTLTGTVTDSGELTLGGTLSVAMSSLNASGTRSSSTYLRGDGTWASTGTVTSVTGSGTVAGLTLTGTVTGSGQLTLGGTLAVPVGNINASGTADSTTYLRGDGTWATSGSVTSVSGTGTVAGLTLTGTVTGSGQLTLGGTLAVPVGNINASGTADSTTYLRGDGTWATSGSVTSVSGTGTVAGLTLTGTVTSSGELTLGGTLAVPVGNINASGTPSGSTFLRGDGTWHNAVTSVSGAGGVSGLTLTGTVTGTGNLTLGGTLSVNIANINASGTADETTFLRGDGTWASVSGSGSTIDLTSVSSSIIPSANVTYDLGTSAYRWKDLYLSGNSIHLGNAVITTNLSGGIVLPAGSDVIVPIENISATGTRNNTTYLRGDGTWATISGGSGSGGSGITVLSPQFEYDITSDYVNTDLVSSNPGILSQLTPHTIYPFNANSGQPQSVTLPWSITVLGQTYSTIYVNQHSFITFGATPVTTLYGKTIDRNFYHDIFYSPKSIGVPALFLGTEVAQCIRYYHGTMADGRFVIRFEKSAGRWGGAGDAVVNIYDNDFAWEMILDPATPSTITISGKYKNNVSRFPGLWGLTDGTKLLESFNINPAGPDLTFNTINLYFDSAHTTGTSVNNIKFSGPHVNTIIDGDTSYINIDPWANAANVVKESDMLRISAHDGIDINSIDNASFGLTKDAWLYAGFTPNTNPTHGGDLFLGAGDGPTEQAGMASFSGGKVDIIGGRSYTQSSISEIYGGNVSIYGGQTFSVLDGIGSSGNVNIVGGSADYLVGGSVNITVGESTNAHSHGSVNIKTISDTNTINTWEFYGTSLTIPQNCSIKNSYGTVILDGNGVNVTTSNPTYDVNSSSTTIANIGYVKDLLATQVNHLSGKVYTVYTATTTDPFASTGYSYNLTSGVITVSSATNLVIGGLTIDSNWVSTLGGTGWKQNNMDYPYAFKSPYAGGRILITTDNSNSYSSSYTGGYMNGIYYATATGSTDGWTVLTRAPEYSWDNWYQGYKNYTIPRRGDVVVVAAPARVTTEVAITKLYVQTVNTISNAIGANTIPLSFVSYSPSVSNLTFNTSGGAASGTVYNGATSKTIDYSTIGAAPSAGSSSITTVGTVTAGTWNGSVIAGTYGGTGVNNGTKTITLGGNLTTSGAFATTLTVTAATNVTLPTTGTLITNAVTTLSSLASIGTITTGIWNGTVIAGQYGGTGVANTGKTITLGGNLTTSGAFATTLTVTAATNVTLPTTGTLATLAGAETLSSKTLTGIAGLGIRDTSAAFDVTIAATSSTTLTAGRTLTLDMVNAARSIKLQGNIDLGGNLTTSGAFATTLTVTAATNVTLPTTGTLSTQAGTETLTNKRITSRVNSQATPTTLAWNSDSYDIYVITALNNALSVSADAGTPTDGQRMLFRIKDAGTSQAITWNTTVATPKAFRQIGTTLPSNTFANKTTYVGCVYNGLDAYWDVIAVTTEV